MSARGELTVVLVVEYWARRRDERINPVCFVSRPLRTAVSISLSPDYTRPPRPPRTTVVILTTRPSTLWMPDLHIHDLRHTVGMRLREADVREETIAAILWHTRPGMTAHYSVAQVAELVEALNRITDERHRTNRSLAMIAREAMEAKKSPKLPMQMKSG